MPALDRIRIAGFKSIRDQTVELRPLNVLIGANGAGKSNFLQVFRFLSDLSSEILQLAIAKAGGADAVLHFGRKRTSRLLLSVRFGQDSYSCSLVPAAPDTLVFEKERTSLFLGKGASRESVEFYGAGHKETSLIQEVTDPYAQDQPTVAGRILRNLWSLRPYHFHDTGEDAKVKQSGAVGDDLFLARDGANLAAFLFRIRENHPHSYREIVEAVRLPAPFFQDFELRPDSSNSYLIRLAWREKGADHPFDVHALSDGALRYICLATLLLQPDPPETVLIDEPELGLHPFAINILVDLIKLASSRTQVILCTQSAAIVDQLEPEDILLVEREGSESIFRRPVKAQLSSWLEDYSLGELWQKNVLAAVGT